jgi:hypothetical protein
MSSFTTSPFPQSFTNRVETGDTSRILLTWLEEDLESLRSQRTELDQRIARVEQRISTLRDPRAMDHASNGTTNGASNGSSNGSSSSDSMPPASTNGTSAAPDTPAYDGPRRSIISLGLENRTYNALVKHGVSSFPQLMKMSRSELRALPGFGAGSLADLEAALARVDVTLPEGSSRSSASHANPKSASLQSTNGYSNAIESSASTSEATSHNGPVNHDSEANTTNRVASATQYEEATALAFKFGVLRLESLRDALNISDNSTFDLLNEDSRWTAHGGGWYVRTPVEQSWIAKRVVEILSAVRSIAVEPLYQAIKRIAANKFLEHGCQMPTRSLLVKIVQELVVEGVRFDIIKEIASMDAPTGELSGSTRAILSAFGTGQRAIINAEIMPHFLEIGMTEGSANVAISTSPLIIKLERGIYGLVGRNADMRDIANARLRREAGKALEPVEG